MSSMHTGHSNSLAKSVPSVNKENMFKILTCNFFFRGSLKSSDYYVARACEPYPDLYSYRTTRH